MMTLLKKLFGRKEEKKEEEEAPGRTFKRILTGDYFGLRNPDATAEMVQVAKQDKIDQIRELGLTPKFLRYARKKTLESPDEIVITAAHVVFQKEEYDDKLHMIHVTEISFLVPKEEFEEFERMAGVSLKDDFRDLYEAEQAYKGKERRKKPRSSPLEQIEKEEH
jgi:hypothetical protein